eukprot:4744332-Alexandrium_andersonii.AAC.1
MEGGRQLTATWTGAVARGGPEPQSCRSAQARRSRVGSGSESGRAALWRRCSSAWISGRRNTIG